MARKRPKTNVEIVRDIMEYSGYGALAQLFVMDALHKMSDAVAASDPNDPKYEGGFVSGEAWVGVAKEIQRKLKPQT